MSFFQFDQKKVETRTFEPLPIGEYEVIITDVEPGESSQKKTPQIECTLTVRDDVDQPYQKRKIFHTLFFTPNTVQMNINFLDTLGFEGAQDFKDITDFARAIQYKPVRVKIRHEPYTSNQGEEKIAERVHYTMKTRHGKTNITKGDPFAGESTVDVKEEDLPF